MAWITPLLAGMSAWITLASLTTTPSLVSKTRVRSLAASAAGGMSAARTSPRMAW